MAIIALEVDELTAKDYDSFHEEMRKKVSNEVISFISKMVFDTRVTKLKKLVDEINLSPNSMPLDPEIIMELLRIEENDGDY